MMLLAWHRGARAPYPVLHYVALPAKGEGDPDTRNRVLQANTLTEAQENELDKAPDGVSRLDMAAQFYPYISPAIVEEAVDTVLTMREVLGAIDASVDDYRRKMRKQDGQSALIDKENGSHV